jgi:hypothetical protein
LFPEYNEGNGKRQKPKALAVILDHVKDEDGDGAANVTDVELFLKRNKAARIALKGDAGRIPRRRFSQRRVRRASERGGHRRHQPAVLAVPRVRRPARGASRREFLIIGSKNAITYKEIFPLIKETEMWLGVRTSTPMERMYFQHCPILGRWLSPVCGGSLRQEARGLVKFRKRSCWYTNLDHGRRHQKLPLMTMADNLKFSTRRSRGKAAYDRYDNYDAIEVGTFTDAKYPATTTA